MKVIIRLLLIQVFSLLLINTTNAQITPQEAIQKIKRGINLGNSLDANPTETSWGNPLIEKYYFDDYVNAGFTCVRIPITWKDHISNTTPYTINQTWLNRVDTVVSWALAKGLYVIINIHHEDEFKKIDTMKNLVAKAEMIAKYDSLWSQISFTFKGKSEKLFFEMLNEPLKLSLSTVNAYNKRILGIIRKTNPTRIVLFSGTDYTGADKLIEAAVPDVNDKYLMAYFHSYDPWSFAGEAKGTWSNVSPITTMFSNVAYWSKTNNIPVVINEFGAINKCDYNSRMYYYAVYVNQALKNNIAFTTWDDNGNFQCYNRSTRTWNDAKDVIIHTYNESPTKLKASIVDTTITISWTNRTTLNDSIIVDRKTSNTTFVPIAKISPTATSFKDSALLYNNSYYYRLRTNLLDSIDLYSYSITAKTPVKSITNDEIKKGGFNIYPNPATKSIVIERNAETFDKTMEIYNSYGLKIKSIILPNTITELSLDGISNGIYFFVNNSYSKKILIQN